MQEPLREADVLEETTKASATNVVQLIETVLDEAYGSVWESNPQGAVFQPPTGFEDQGPHQRCKHSQGDFNPYFTKPYVKSRNQID